MYVSVIHIPRSRRFLAVRAAVEASVMQLLTPGAHDPRSKGVAEAILGILWTGVLSQRPGRSAERIEGIELRGKYEGGLD
jgi:hypothetical protein